LAVAVAPDGRTILAGGDGPELLILILDVEDGVEVRRVACTPPVFSVAFTSDGRRLLAGGGDGSIVQVAADGRGDPRMLSTGSGNRGGGNAHAIWSIAVSDDGRRAVSAGGDGTAILWDLAERREVRRVSLADGRLRSAAIEAGGRRAVLGLQFGNFSGGGALATWDLDSDDPPIVGQAIPAPLGLATLPGGEVASADADGSVRIRVPSRSLHEARKLAFEGREEASLSLYNEAVRSLPRDARLLIERGRLLARRGSTAAADAHFARAAELSDNPQLFLDGGWWLSGLYPPWDRKSSPELPAGLDPSRPPPTPVDGLGAPGWSPIATQGRGSVALGSVLGTVAPRSSLALTVVASASPRDVALLMRADDWGQLWVNGQRALSTAGGPCYSPWAEKLRLPAGKSTLVAGVVNEIGEHSVELRLSDDPAELGRSEMARGEWADAEAHFTAAIARSPSVPDSYRDRGDARAQMGRWRDADADFGQAGRIRPRAEAERIRSAYARLAADDLPGAREVCRELARAPAIGDDPAGARPLLTLLGATPDALEDYSAVLPVARRLALSEDDPGTSEILGALLSRAGEWEAAFVPLKRSIDETGERGGAVAWARYALCLARLRRPGAREAMRRAEDLAPRELSALRDAGRRDSSLWVEAVALEHLLKEARAALAPAP
jgi:tetratricopeptide (TPR) repeat protein